MNNTITEVILEKANDIDQVHFFLGLCLRIHDFQINIPVNMDVQMLVRSILTKTNADIPRLKSLSLHISNDNEDIIHQIQELIDSEKLLSNYDIKYSRNNVLLKWN